MRKHSRSSQLFDDALSIIDEMLFAIQRPRASMRFSHEEFLAMSGAKEQRYCNQAIADWKKQKLIKTKKQGAKVFYELTEKGKAVAFKRAVLQKRSRHPKGIVCSVSFDVPESVRHVRHALRGLLKDIGFKQQHQSLWESNKDVCHELKAFVKIMKAEEWIHVYCGRRII